MKLVVYKNYLDFFLFLPFLNVKLILFILTLAVHLTWSCILFHSTNTVRLGSLMATGFVDTLLIAILLLAYLTPCH